MKLLLIITLIVASWVRTALYHGTSSIFNELLSNKMGNEIYMLKVAKGDENKTYKELFSVFKDEKNATLLGIKRDENVLLNPDNSELLEAGDQLIYIAQNKLAL